MRGKNGSHDFVTFALHLMNSGNIVEGNWIGEAKEKWPNWSLRRYGVGSIEVLAGSVTDLIEPEESEGT